ncbi:DNA-directed RNA polymerase II largest subunit, putative [Coccidioides posadasii C735 delta SOWgp]|uniref:DNA-directed RNA polymerase subunit n=1 Tax=Coccidioides posadasii (strain C735) TaxID=222929 RepID=C5PA97_COCP7|nr:DNA-directed RNA polymerase II largest subunit, putative [Coccidioides posadasii C735 delta SOWgp]EER26659.1 DNA-directed RNA polymerase II largest subunit, putative [Coccidioides posadasii C735 delta SOWgp]|eukprot:XP_003068804.1 DNA-directed RNA polymerase II largest subunit, putative [Coccidioides posadasii C735 delta SOWgp]
MASFTRPVSSTISGVDFEVLSDNEIKSVSVKRIHNTPTLDSFNNPVPGGLYDPALGAWGDHICTTCRLNAWSCAGHSGHIELPVHVYNVTFFDQLFRLLKAQCIYCHRFRMSKIQINTYVCKLRLLQYGLVEEASTIGTMELRKGKHNKGDGESDSSEDEDEEDLIDRRNAYVQKCISGLASYKTRQNYMKMAKNPAAAEMRRNLVRDFLKDVANVKKCASCSGISPPYRRDRYSKIFRKSLPQKAKAAMVAAGFQIPNPLVLMEEANRLSKKHKTIQNEDSVNGIIDDGNISVITETHGAEQQVSMGNAVLAAVEDTESSEAGGQLDDSQQYIPSSEVYASVRFLFEKEQEILDLVYDSRPGSGRRSHVNADMFFIKNLLVPPNKYRPAAQQGPGQIMEAQQNTSFTRILKLCDQINQISRERQGDNGESISRIRSYRDLLHAIVQLQDAVNSLIDRDRNPAQGAAGIQNEDGIKQRLEKKDGLFRKNMMGKRVNFAARSVISPDPNIETNEIGIPLVFAKKLTYPEPVTNHNYWELKQAVINGPDIYPGAAAVENELGQVVNLKFKSVDERIAIANMLLSPSNWKLKRSRNKKVYRHLTTGDVVLMNRQPTLHKPSIMGHRARVLTGERTIRMHYANCNTYNADFDGDEMNLHFPQNEIARAEAMQLADTDHQYLVATSGKPLRGLIQDHISMGTWFTSRDSLFDEEDYHQLLYSCLRPENSHTVSEKIELMPPTILKPKPRWTGKQIISTILKNITPENRAGLNLIGKSSTPGDRWEIGSEEGKVIVKDGELLCGILDKAQLGPSAGGLIHSVHEVFGHVVAGKLIGILGRLLTRFLQMRAFTCGMDDLRLTKKGDEERKKQLKRGDNLGHEVALQYVTLDESPVEDKETELQRRLEDVLRDDEKQAGLDSMFNSRTAGLSSDITAACLPSGLEKPFPWNQMQAMTVSGAKGSVVNANLISCNLGQQVLEGRRVPVMISGKTLPSFKPFETKLVAGGYVSGRFLTGIKPQEYYFHAMAGREGLIDTAVKTSRSGYLQRCLIKGMEGLKAEYDNSVRDTTDGTLVQFLYGEDGLDITKQKHLQDFSFLAQNYLSILSQVNGMDEFNKVHSEVAAKWNKSAIKKVKRTGQVDAKDPVLAHYHPGANFGSTSESFATALKEYEKKNPDKLLKDKGQGIDGISKKDFEHIMNMKYMRSVVDPGEAVGIVAGQSIGEPSTQMTLNTFHLAGHSAKNVTLGIPRLREIVMTASTQILTPTMSANFYEQVSTKDRELFAKGISRLTLAEVVDKLSVHERISNRGNVKAKVYDIHINFFPAEEYTQEYAIKVQDVLETLEKRFVPKLVKLTRAELKKRTSEKSLSDFSAAQPEIGASVGVVEEGPRNTEGREAANDDDEDEDQDDAKRARSSQNRSNQVSYEAPDEDDQDIIRRQDSSELDSEDEDESSENKEKRPASGDEDVEMKDASDVEDEDKEREESIRDKHAEVTRFKFDPKKGTSCIIQLQYDVSTPKLLLLPLVENATRAAVIQFIPGLGSCTYVPEERDTPAHILTDGVNLLAMRDYQHIINMHTLYSNSIHHMLTLYGVEAARASIVREMDSVFKSHSIAVDNRHLNLIGDVMTQSGGFRPFNRMGIVKDSTSPFMKMSFETTVRFLRDAVLERDWDNLAAPSSRIVMGRVSTVGTGSFDVLAPVG